MRIIYYRYLVNTKSDQGVFSHYNKSETEDPRIFGTHIVRSEQTNDILLEENGVLIRDKREITEAFNNYFTHIADAAAKINEEDFGTDFSAHSNISRYLETIVRMVHLISISNPKIQNKWRGFCYK